MFSKHPLKKLSGGSRPRPDEMQRSFRGRLKKSRTRLGLDPSNKELPKQEFFSHSSEILKLMRNGHRMTSVTHCCTVVEFDRKLLLKVLVREKSLILPLCKNIAVRNK